MRPGRAYFRGRGVLKMCSPVCSSFVYILKNGRAIERLIQIKMQTIPFLLLTISIFLNMLTVMKLAEFLSIFDKSEQNEVYDK